MGVGKFLLAGGSLEESRKAYETALGDEDCYCTLGVHPCRANEVANVDTYFQELHAMIPQLHPKLLAIGECGLDYDRFHYSSKEQQLAVFPPHFALAESTRLPLYLHSRNTNGDFSRLLRSNRHRFTTGLVHSFTGSETELRELLEMDLYIGVNGCSLKTEENVNVVRAIPLEKMMIETDCPYCEIRKSHAGFRYVKTHFQSSKKRSETQPLRGRNEPMFVVQVLEAVAAIKGVTEDQVAEITTQNAINVFRFPV